MSEEKLDYGLLRDFHLQFAQNQNHHQSLVYKFFAGFSVLIVTFVYATVNQKSYLIQNVLTDPTKIQDAYFKGHFIVSDNAYLAYAVFISFLFAFSFGYVVQTAYIFRRDQYMVRKIRKKAGGLSSKIFTKYGQLKPGWMWPPDLFQFLLFIILLFNVSITVYMFSISPVTVLLRGTGWLFILPYFIMFFFYFRYCCKYHKKLIGKQR